MKTVYKSAVLAAIMLGVLHSCNFLETDYYTKDMQQFESIFLKENTTREWLWNVYASMVSAPGIQNGGTFYASDEMVWNDDGGNCEKYHNCQYNADTQLWEDRYRSLYVGIRNASVFIHSVNRCTEISQSDRNSYQAEAKFLRAYFYFQLIRQYGPVPLIPDEGQDITLSYEELAIPRAPMDNLVEFIVKDLEEAVPYLPSEYPTSWLGRATVGAALALRAKVLLYAASPLFNGNTEMFDMKDCDGNQLIPQTYDESKWARAAAAAKEVIDLGKYQLMVVNPTSDTPALPEACPTAAFPNGCGGVDPYESYAQLFNGEVPLNYNTEVILVRQDVRANMNFFVHRAFPYSHNGANDMGATMKQVEAYYQADGRDAKQASTEYPAFKYGDGFVSAAEATQRVPRGVHKMWLNKEPRFYASIAFNGSRWENGTADTKYQNFACNYYRAGSDGKQLSRPYNYPLSGIGIRKYYNPDDSWDTGGRTTNKPQIEIRYADVLLWYAEALNELTTSYTFSDAWGEGSITVSRDVEQMRSAFSQVRFRAGIPDLTDAEYASQDIFREKLKRERRIEFFMEGNRYYDVRRWKDAPIDENEPLMGLNVDVKESANVTQKEMFYETTPVQMSKVFMTKMYFWPFSTGELKRNSKLTQNPGW